MRIPDPEEVLSLAQDIKETKAKLKELEQRWVGLFSVANEIVAVSESPSLQLRIVQLLDSRPNDVFTVSRVAGELNANENSVGPYLSRLVSETKIAKRGRGLYGSLDGVSRVIGQTDEYAFVAQ